MLSVFRPIAPYIRKRATPLAASAAMSALASGFALVPFFVAYRLIALAFANDIAGLHDESLWLLAAAAAGIVVRSLLTAGAAYAAHAAAFALLADLRRAAAEKLARLPLDFLDRQQSGRLKTILRDDVDRLEDAFAHAVPDIAAGVAAPVLTAAALFMVDWRMTLALIAMAPVLVALYVWTMRAKRSLISAYGQALARFNAQAVEVARGIKVLKAYGGAPRALDELLATVDELAAINEAAERVSLAPWSAFLVCLRATLLVVVPVGGWLALSGSLDAATFLLFVLLSLVFNQPLLNLAYTATGFVWKVHLAGRNFAWLMETPEIAEPAAPRRPAGDDLRFDDVAVRHDDKTILSNVTFSVPAGSMTALVGASGAGKTSLALLVARFAEPAAGHVRIGGVDVAEMSERDLLARVAMVFQDTFLFDDTIYENIRLGRPDASAEEIRDAARRAQVTEFSDAFPEDLDTPVGQNGGRLSGGQRQRVAIARALLKDAPIILLDEATASLDPETEAQVLIALAELVAGRTTLVIAHRLASVRVADQVAFLHDGALRACGPHEDLIARDEVYAAFWSEKSAGAPSAIPAALTRKDVRNPPTSVSVTEEPAAPEPLATGSAWRTLLSLLGPARAPLTRRAAPLLALETIFSSAPVFIALSVVIAVSSNAFDASGAVRATIFLVATYAISGALTYAAQSILFRSQRLAASSLQRRVIRHMMSLPLGFFQGAGGNAVSGLFSNHLGQLDLVTPPTLLIRAAAMPAVSALFLLWFDWRLGLAALAGVPVFAAVLFWNGRSHVEASRRLLACRERANTLTLEYLLGLPVARSFQLIGDRLPRFSRAIRDEAQAALAATRPIAIIAAVGPAALELGFVAILALGGSFFVEGSLSAAAIAIFVTLGLVFYRPMFDLIELVAYGRSLAGHVEAIAAVLAVAPLPSLGAATVAPSGSAVRFRDVSFAYGERHGGLRNIDIEAPEGKVTAIVGPSGAGKSTALSLLARFWDVERGSIEIGGVDIRNLPLTELYSRLSIVFQDPFLFRDTARANIALGRPGAADDDIMQAAVAAQIHETIAALPNGYDTVLGENGAPLSGGERQRLALARALLKDSEIVLLDEAVAAVDPDAKEDIRTALARLCAGKTVLVVSHDLASAAHADHIVVLETGHVVTQGRHADLLARGGLYARLWNIQANARSIAIRSSENITASAAQ